MAARYTQERLQEAVSSSESIAGVLRYLGVKQAGGSQSHISKRIKDFGIDTSHFTGAAWNKGKTFKNLQRSSDSILVLLPEGSHRIRRRLLLRAMLEVGIEYKCRCGLTDEWQGSRICLEIDHINGDWLDNRIDNLRFLCPNCHSQEDSSNKPHKYRIN